MLTMRNGQVLAALVSSLTIWCSGCALDRPANPLVAATVETIAEHDLQRCSRALAEIGSRPGNNAPKTALTVQFIENELRNAGYRALSQRPDASAEAPGEFNVVAEIKGTRRPECVVELGSHYDTVPFSPGADDNGSGVAGTLAVARALANVRSAKTVRFIFYCREDMDGGGSRTHVRNVLHRTDERFEGAIIFEMIGYAVDAPNTQKTPIRIPFLLWPPSTGNFVAVVGNARSAFIGDRYERAARVYQPAPRVYSLRHLGGLLKDASRSDNASYWESNLPALMLTDTGNFRNPNYHEPSDRLGTLNHGFMCGVTRATAATLLEWAEVEAAATDRAGDDGHDGGLVRYREAVPPPKPGPVPLNNPTIGISIAGMTREQACRRIASDYWTAVIGGNDDIASSLWCAYPSGEAMHWHEQFRPQDVVNIGEPSRREGCFDDLPTLVIPSRIRFSNGRVLDQNLIVLFRDLGLTESCVIIGLWTGR